MEPTSYLGGDAITGDDPGFHFGTSHSDRNDRHLAYYHVGLIPWLCGVACILGSILFARKLPALREMVRPIYIEKEILSKELK